MDAGRIRVGGRRLTQPTAEGERAGGVRVRGVRRAGPVKDECARSGPGASPDARTWPASPRQRSPPARAARPVPRDPRPGMGDPSPCQRDRETMRERRGRLNGLSTATGSLTESSLFPSTTLSMAFIACSSVLSPGLLPWSRSIRSTHLRRVSAKQPSFSATERTAAHRDACSPPFSRTIRTDRSRTSGENLLALAMAPCSQGMEPPKNPVRTSGFLVPSEGALPWIAAGSVPRGLPAKRSSAERAACCFRCGTPRDRHAGGGARGCGLRGSARDADLGVGTLGQLDVESEAVRILAIAARRPSVNRMTEGHRAQGLPGANPVGLREGAAPGAPRVLSSVCRASRWMTTS